MPLTQAHRRRGGESDRGKKTVIVRYAGKEHTVSWFAGASDESISRTINNTLGFPDGMSAVVRDSEDDTVLAISSSIPDGLTLEASPTTLNREFSTNSMWPGREPSGKREGGARGSPKCKSSDDGFNGGSDEHAPGEAEAFRGELLKFERVNAHLANERTWLAWVRTALSVLSLALSLLSLTEDMTSVFTGTLALMVGVGFVACTIFTYLTGWLRYVRVKEVLTWQGKQVKAQFGRFGLGYQAKFLGIALVLTVPLYIAGGVHIVRDS